MGALKKLGSVVGGVLLVVFGAMMVTVQFNEPLARKIGLSFFCPPLAERIEFAEYSVDIARDLEKSSRSEVAFAVKVTARQPIVVWNVEAKTGIEGKKGLTGVQAWHPIGLYPLTDSDVKLGAGESKEWTHTLPFSRDRKKGKAMLRVTADVKTDKAEEPKRVPFTLDIRLE